MKADKSINTMRVGSRLVFGSYGVDANDPVEIRWLKASPENHFISEFVLDWLCYDAPEGERYHNPIWELSNLCAFLNSDRRRWYMPTHDDDRPPAPQNVQRSNSYQNHDGFLAGFTDKELSLLKNQTYQIGEETLDTLVRLPAPSEILSAGLPLFKRKGMRAHPCEDLRRHKMRYCSAGSFTSYWLLPTSSQGYLVSTLSIGGAVANLYPNNGAGIRPVIQLSDAPVDCDDQLSLFRLSNFTIEPKIPSQNDIYKLLGICP